MESADSAGAGPQDPGTRGAVRRDGEGRERILAAVVDVIADEGIDRASVRAVAQRAGVSIGAVQHHFRTKAQMLEGAMAHLTARFEAEARSDAAATAFGVDEPDGPPDPLLVLRTMCAGLALLDEGDRRVGGVWLDFVAASRVNGGLAEIHRTAWSRLRGLFAHLMAQAEPGHPDVEAAADLLLACLDGIAVSRMTEAEHMTAARAERTMEAALSGVLSERPGPHARADCA